MISGLYRYAVEEELLGNTSGDPVWNRVLHNQPGPQRGRLTARRRRTRRTEATCADVPACNQQVTNCEAPGADALGIERGLTPTVLRKGAKTVTIPLGPRTTQAIDLAIGVCPNGPIFLRPGGQQLVATERVGSPAAPASTGPWPD